MTPPIFSLLQALLTIKAVELIYIFEFSVLTENKKGDIIWPDKYQRPALVRDFLPEGKGNAIKP